MMDDNESGVGLLEPKLEVKSGLCPMWKILIHNDDRTPMDFVILVLREVWNHELVKSLEIMTEAHVTGLALVAIHPRELCELRLEQAQSIVKTTDFPLTFSMEEDC